VNQMNWDFLFEKVGGEHGAAGWELGYLLGAVIIGLILVSRFHKKSKDDDPNPYND